MASRRAQRRDAPTLAEILGPFPLDDVHEGSPCAASPIHGDEHWRAVATIGLALAAETPGADARVAFLFGLLHDCQRHDEGHDPEHGPRAADYVRRLEASGRLRLEPDALNLLEQACRAHSSETVSDDPTIGVCWDADRLHLVRLGLTPLVEYLSTTAGKLFAEAWRATSLMVGVPSWDELLATPVGEAPSLESAEMRSAIAAARQNLGVEQWVTSLSGPEWAALIAFSVAGHELNAAIRHGTAKEDAELDEALARSTTRAPLTVFRATDPRAFEWDGDLLTDRAYVSTTLSRRYAEWRALTSHDQGIVVRLDVPAGAHAVLVPGEIRHRMRWYDGLGPEQMHERMTEVILPRRSRFRVSGYDGGALHLELVTAEP